MTATTVRRQDDDAAALAAADGAVGDSLVVAAWTMVSRITGILRVVVLGAVVGPTVFGNLYQLTNTLPNALYYGLLAGSLVSSLLVPALVRKVDAGDPQACARIAGSFLGAVCLGLALLLPVFLLATPALLSASAPAAGVSDARVEEVARWLLVLLLPQVFLYALAGSAAAVMHAQRRFALTAAAPAVENIGCIVTLLLAWFTFEGGLRTDDPSTGQLLLLGGGTTASVALHAALQWYGAWRCGVVLRPRAGWRDAEVVALMRRSVPALVYSGLGAVQIVGALVVTNRVAGGVVAYQIALSFFFLPVALGAAPVAVSLLPRLARLVHSDVRLFRDTLVRGLRLACFLTLPAAVVLAVLAPGLARAVSFGQMDTPRAHSLIALALTALAGGVVAEAAFLVATYASYARGDTRSPLRSMAVKTATCLVVLVLAYAAAGGHATLLLAGCALSAAALVGAVHQVRHLLAGLPVGEERLVSALWPVTAAGVVVAVPLLAVRGWLAGLPGHAELWFGHVAAITAAGLLFVGVAQLLRVPEARWVRQAAAAKLRLDRGATRGAAP